MFNDASTLLVNDVNLCQYKDGLDAEKSRFVFQCSECSDETVGMCRLVRVPLDPAIHLNSLYKLTTRVCSIKYLLVGKWRTYSTFNECSCLLNLSNELGKVIKCEACRAFYHFFEACRAFYHFFATRKEHEF